jgi:hypothetical protein
MAAGALVVATVAAPGPVKALRGLTRSTGLLACAGGLLAFFGAPALVAGLRMTDAPAGSIVVFWVSGGWAAIAACGAAALALRERLGLSAGWSFAGALLALAGVAGVVADWERPSSFSPLVRFASREMGMLAGGLLLLAGGLLIVRAAKSARLDAALLCASASALAASLVWWGATDFARGWSRVAEQPLAVAVAAVSWGLVCVSWPACLKTLGAARGAAAMSVAPVLLSGLVWLEQAVGVAGPQPLVVPGVVAGSLVVLAGVCALAHARDARRAKAAPLLSAAAAVPALLALVALALPALIAKVDVTIGGTFSGSWTMAGDESVAGWVALALVVLAVVATFDARPLWPIAAALAASVAWPWLLDVPTHVWNASLAPDIQVYYGTEHGSIVFTTVPNVPMAGAVILGALVMLAIMVARRSSVREALHLGHGGK